MYGKKTNFNDIDLYQKNLNELMDRKEKNDKFLIDFGVKNLEYLRNYWLHLTIVSAAILVAILPLFKNNPDIIKIKEFCFLGLFILALIQIISPIYLNHLLTKENDNLTKKRDFSKKIFGKYIAMLDENYKQQKSYLEHIKLSSVLAKQFSKEEKELIEERNKIKKFFDKHFSDIITYMFIAGLTLIILSFISWEFILNLIFNLC